MKIKKEINFNLNLSTEEVNRLNMHSFVNVLNVIIGSLELLGYKLKNKVLFASATEVSLEILSSFHNKELALQNAEKITNYKAIILDSLDNAERIYVQDDAIIRSIRDTRKNLLKIFEVVDVRVREILARNSVPDKWEAHSADLLVKNMKQVLEAIRVNSKNPFKLSYNAANHTPDSYLILFAINSHLGDKVLMPPVVQDSFRDLIANARKYTPVGGTIKASIIQDENELVVQVSDNGRGIPGDEIEKVVEYGLRGSNTHPAETKGGGFGLTKAYLVCRQFHGKMFIESGLDAGTTINLHFPSPQRSFNQN